MVEEQVDEILLLSQRQPVLAADKAEAVAEFEKERLQAGDQPVFQLPLLHLPADAEEFEIVGTLEHFFGLLGQILRQGEGKVVRLLLRHRPLIRAGLDLVEEDIARHQPNRAVARR